MSKNHKAHAELEINAPREKVWAVLTDFANLSQWSSSFLNLEGEFKEGGKATATFKGPMGKNITFEHTIINFREGHSFGWSDPIGMAGMKDHHTYLLEELPNGNTKFTQTDEATEGASFFLGGLMAKMMDKAYEQFNQELKNRVESMD